MSAYLIVNLAGANPRPGGLALSPLAGSPRFVHTDREAADGEMLRLQAINDSAEFVLFEAVARVESK